MPIHIKEIECYLPETIVTNEQLQRDNPSWNMTQVAGRSGVQRRHIAADDVTALDLAVEACRRLTARNPNTFKKIGGLIFCTQSGDHIMPPNSCILHERLKLGEDIFAFDINSACSGFVHGLTIAQGLIESGTAKEVLLVNADTYSKFIHPQDRSARVLFGDGASATILAPAKKGQGLEDIVCATAGDGYKKFIIPAGACRMKKSAATAQPVSSGGSIRTQEHIFMDGLGILSFVSTKVPAQVKQLLKRNRLTVDDIDLFVFHQASQMALDALTRILNIDSTKVFNNLQDLGNLVSASIPIALKQAIEEGRIKKGDRVLISGFGVGLTWASAIIRF